MLNQPMSSPMMTRMFGFFAWPLPCAPLPFPAPRFAIYLSPLEVLRRCVAVAPPHERIHPARFRMPARQWARTLDERVRGRGVGGGG